MSKTLAQPVRKRPAADRGFTLVELLVVIAILAALISIAAFGATAAYKHMKKNTARQQLTLIANAIEKYTTFWPRWEVGGVVVAEKGFPDFIPGRLFATGGVVGFPAGVFGSVAGFNNAATNLEFPLQYLDEENDQQELDEYVEHAGECLLYAMTSTSGKGPYITDEMQGNLQSSHAAQFYPTLGGGSTGGKRGEFIDPWGKPYRYFWVYRDVFGGDPNDLSNSYNGFLAVDYGAFLRSVNDGGAGRVDNPAFLQNDPARTPKTAVNFVVESAGPDGFFGNIWKVDPTDNEITRAEDNVRTPL